MVFVQNRKIAKRLESLEGKESEAICTISKKKWCIIRAYRPPQNVFQRIKSFFKSMRQ